MKGIGLDGGAGAGGWGRAEECSVFGAPSVKSGCD